MSDEGSKGNIVRFGAAVSCKGKQGKSLVGANQHQLEILSPEALTPFLCGKDVPRYPFFEFDGAVVCISISIFSGRESPALYRYEDPSPGVIAVYELLGGDSWNLGGKLESDSPLAILLESVLIDGHATVRFLREKRGSIHPTAEQVLGDLKSALCARFA